jgi:pimeloyl-ACP methyl ester carboxylesterase
MREHEPVSRSRYVVNSAGVRLHVREWGSQQSLCVLLHGSGDGAYIWAESAESFAGSHRLLAPDLRGHGDSEWDRAGAYSIGSHVADVQHVLDELGAARFALVGHSLGGLLALHLAAAEAHRIDGLVLVDSGPGLSCVARQYAREQFMRQFRMYDSVAQYASWLSENRPMASAASLERIAECALRRLPGGGFQLKSDPATADTRGEFIDDAKLDSLLDRIACPTLVLRGRASAMFSTVNAQRTVRRLRQGRLYTISNAGHGVMTDNPAAFSTVVTRFLRSLRQDSPTPFLSSHADVG